MTGGRRRADKPTDNWLDVVISTQRAMRSFEEHIAPILSEEGVSPLALQSVVYLMTLADGPRRIRDIVIEDRSPSPNVHYGLASLEKEGLIVKNKDPRDRRGRFVVPTERGRRLIQAVRKSMSGKGPDVADALRSVSLLETHCTSRPVRPASVRTPETTSVDVAEARPVLA